MGGLQTIQLIVQISIKTNSFTPFEMKIWAYLIVNQDISRYTFLMTS